ncbi:MAG TPA: hypothetical protein VIO61_07755 [Anaerolineaceae bacterium]
MIVTAWNDGAHSRSGKGYGFRVAIPDRDAFFQKDWEQITLTLEGEDEPVEIALNPAHFWGDPCRELVHPKIGKWLHKEGLAPWARGNPPRLVLEPVEGSRFILSKPRKSSRPF